MEKILEEKKPKVIIEDGGGEHSTALFIHSQAEVIITVEEDPDWKEKLDRTFGEKDYLDRWWLTDIWDASFRGLKVDLVFIDGKKETRAERANDAFRKKVPIVVIHDTEFTEFYGLDKLTPLGYTEEVHVDKDSAFKGTPGRQKQTSVFTLQKYKVHLKLYGLPRTYTNWIAFNIMKTWPEVKVWGNNGPFSPDSEAFWKHGVMKEVKGINGYILVSKEWKVWKRSMKRYLPLNLIKMDERFLPFIWKGWNMEAKAFHAVQLKNIKLGLFWMIPEDPNNTQVEMIHLMTQIKEWFGLSDNHFHIEKKRMWRAGDASTLPQYLMDEDYET